MVLQKRLDYGFNGYQVPAMPRATRSARRRSSVCKKVEGNQMCAFDLLATVAGKLLLDRERTPSSSDTSTEENQRAIVKNTVKSEWHNEDKPMKVETCDSKFFVSELVSQGCDRNCSSKESPCPQKSGHFEIASVTSSEHAERFGAQKLVNGKCDNEVGGLSSMVEVGSSVSKEFGDCKLEGEAKRVVKDKSQETGMCSLEDPVVSDGKPPALVSSDSSAKEHILPSSFPASWDNVNLVCRDDDEKSSGCTHPKTTKKFFRPVPRIGDRRIRKILASKYWKVAPKVKDAMLSNNDRDSKPVHHSRYCYKRQRSERNYPIKKRKFFGCSLASNSDGVSSEGISGLPEKGSGRDAFGLSAKLHGAFGTSSAAGQQSSFQNRDSHVKLRIKSFRVPELFIEVPETATVGSLKRTVMEAVSEILGDGLHVGVLLRGRKVRDDNKTLLQTGISHDNQLDALGFSLEPNPLQKAPPLCHGDASYLLPCDTPQPLTRYPPSTSDVQQGDGDASPELHLRNVGHFVESDHDSAPSPTNMSMDKSTTDSKALVAVPAMSVEALAVVPVQRKSKRSEIVQRRIRRPFSVAEVEALVQAVEKIGTGRWRDVKLRAFDNAKHRTYVDLKDKWKTLVHTARIAPQQRRGEPVPQELLDRVLTAHAYWSQQQAKQQLKQPPETCLLL